MLTLTLSPLHFVTPTFLTSLIYLTYLLYLFYTRGDDKTTGLLLYHGTDDLRTTVRERVQALIQGGEGGNPMAVAMLADMLVAEGGRAREGGAGRALLEEALGWYTLLTSIDGIRAKAWEKRRVTVQAMVDAS